MSGALGVRYGIQTLEDLRQRSVMVPGCDCWHRPATLKGRKDRREDPSVWIPALQSALAQGAAVYFLQHGQRLRKGLAYVRTCDTWGCANPEHRKTMTRAALARMNSRPCSMDRKMKLVATRRRNSRITDADVLVIAASTEPARVVAARYGISKSYVYLLRRGCFRQSLAPANASVFHMAMAAA